MNQQFITSNSWERRTVAPRERAYSFPEPIPQFGVQTAVILPTTHIKECSMSQTLLEMAKDLVMAQIAAHRLAPDEMHAALQQTYTSLQALKSQEDAHGSMAVATPDRLPEPVNWRKSIAK